MTDAAYAPQPWLADFSTATEAIVEANEAAGEENKDAVDAAVDDILHYKRRTYSITCRDCGTRFEAKGPRAMFCPECKRKRQVGTKPIETVLVKRHEPSDMTAADVPDVPSDLYTTAAEKIEKTKPIETCLVPKNDWRAEALEEAASKKEKETNTMDLAKFPSMSNRLAHPENFIEPEEADATDTKKNPKALASFLLDTYTDLAAKCEEQGISMGTFCAKLQELDTLVNSLSA